MENHKISITKYNPIFRDDNWYYTKNEWTSISDIGKCFDDGLFTKDIYISIENLYIKSVFLIISFFNIDKIKIDELYKYRTKRWFKDNKQNDLLKMHNFLYNNMLVNTEDSFVLEKILKLALREIISIEIILNEKSKITFGYDYYMYLESSEPRQKLEVLTGQIENLGLFANY